MPTKACLTRFQSSLCFACSRLGDSTALVGGELDGGCATSGTSGPVGRRDRSGPDASSAGHLSDDKGREDVSIALGYTFYHAA